MWKSDRKKRESSGKVDRIVGTESNPTKMETGQVIINKKATKQNLQKLKAINEDGLSKKQTGKTTTDGTDGGLLKGPPHYDENGKPTGGIPVVVDNSRNIEVEGEEFVVNAEASKKHWQELSKINQSTGNGVPIGPPNGAVDEDPEEYDKGGKIQFNPNHVPNKWILQFAEKVRTEHPKVWDLGGNIFGNEAYKNLKRVAERGYWLDSEEWMYIKWQSYIARHKKDFRIAGVIAMLKWVDKVDRGWAYMKDLIQERIKKEEAKKGWKHKTTKMKDGGEVEGLIQKGIVELKFTETTPEHALERGIKSTKPLYVQNLYVSEDKRLKGVGKKVLDYLESYARKNGNDVIFGYIAQKAKFSKDKRVSFFGDVEMIKNWLHDNGYAINQDDNNFHKVLTDKYQLGGGTVAQTPAPKSDRIKGSDVNKPDSSESTKSGSSIKFDEQTLTTISNKVKEHNDKHPDKKITIGAAKAVVRRGMGAYSSSHRPTIKGGKPNSRTAWGIARLNAFIYKILKGKSKSGKYTQDDDLIEELGYSISKYHLGGDMSKHLAPNGKPSNLTHEQWHLVRTPEFKAWFGDWENSPYLSSVLLDENFEPKVVYHGTNADFNVFDRKQGGYYKSKGSGLDGVGIWFSDNKEYARKFGKNVYEVFLSLKNPKEFFIDSKRAKTLLEKSKDNYISDEEAKAQKEFDAVKGLQKDLFILSDEKIQEKYSVSSDVLPTFRKEWRKKISAIENKLEKAIKLTDQIKSEAKLIKKESDTLEQFFKFAQSCCQDQNYIDTEKVRQELTSEGLTDGVTLYNTIGDSSLLDDEVPVNMYVVLEPEQIKLADGSNTTFDSSNPDIRFASGGLVPRRNINGEVVFSDVWLITRDEYNKENLIVHSGDSLKRKKTALQSYFEDNITNRQHAMKVNMAIQNGLYLQAVKDGLMTRERANEIISSIGNTTDLIPLRYSGGGSTNTDYAELYQVYVLDHNEPVKVFETYNMDEAKSVLNHQKSLGRKGAHIQYSFKDGGVTDSRDSVTLDIPLLIRTLELAREDIKSDADLHRVVENLIKLKNKRVLTMDDYNYIAHIKKHTEKMKQGGTTQAQREKIAKVMHEYKSGNLHSGSKRGPIVTDRDQAIAIALSEANASKYAPGGNVEPIRTLGNGSPVYFETDYLRLNERYNKPGYLLLVNKAGDKDGVPEWELVFDDLNEAVYVADKLNTIYPKGVPEAVLLDKFVDTLKKERNTNESSTEVIDWQNKSIKSYLESVGFAIRTDGIVKYESVEVILWQQRKYEIKRGSAYMVEVGSPEEPNYPEDKGLKIAVIDNIFNNSVRGKGLASLVLDKIIEGADMTKTTLQLIPEQQGDSGLTTEQLTEWYTKRGFKPIGDGDVYQRTPESSKDMSSTEAILDVNKNNAKVTITKFQSKGKWKGHLESSRDYFFNDIESAMEFAKRHSKKDYVVAEVFDIKDGKAILLKEFNWRDSDNIVLTPTKKGFSQKLYRGISEYKNVTYGGRTDEGLGDFWTNNRTMAEWFAGVTDYNVNTGKYEPTGGNGKVLEQVIELKNPYIIDSSHPKYDIDNEHTSWNIMMDEMNARTKEQVQQYVTKLIQKGYDGIIMKDNTTNYYDDGTYDIVVRFTEEQFKNAGVTMNNTISTNVTDYKNPYEVNRAIEKLLESKGTDRDEYTPDEIKFISYYSGYGGLEKLGSFSDEELKGLLYEFFTPDEVVRKMWGLAYKYGYGTIADNSVFEPSVGVGAFLKYVPEDVPVVANEINKWSAKICTILYPQAHVILQSFEQNFIKANTSIKSKIDNLPKYSLVIGNPPYGRLKSKYTGMGESDYTMAGNFVEYFITRGLDLLHPGGLLIYIVGAEQFNGGTLFLDSPISKVKRAIFDKAELLDAYRLPRNVFERTGVSSEIIVLKKK